LNEDSPAIRIEGRAVALANSSCGNVPFRIGAGIQVADGDTVNIAGRWVTEIDERGSKSALFS
jgi:hypothetical protein